MIIRALLLATALSAGNAEFEREALSTAAEISLARLKAEMFSKGLGTNVLEVAMLADPRRFKTRGEAEQICRALYSEATETVYRQRAAAIWRELGGEAKRGELSAADRDKFVSGFFAKAFDAERAAACRRQAETIALKVKPVEAEIESKTDVEARNWLTSRIAEARNLSVFEENLKYISEKIVDPILADARRERKRQQEYLMRTRCEAFAPEVLARELEANLRKNVAERAAKCDDPARAWSVFPATLANNLPLAVERRLVGLLIREIDNAANPVDAVSIEREFRTNQTAHRKSDDSEKFFRNLYAKTLVGTGLTAVENLAPASERESLLKYLRERLEGDELKKALESRLKRDILPQWRKCRAEIVAREADTLWPTLADASWYPSAELADRILAAPDRRAALQAWRTDRSFGELAHEVKIGFEEVEETGNRRVGAAFDLAGKALATQNAIVDEVHPPILLAARDLSSGIFSRKPDLASVIEMLSNAAVKEWDERRVKALWGEGRRPKNVDEQHVELFPSVRKKIELIARQILEELEQKRSEAESETPSDSDSSEEELCTISFRVDGGEVVVEAKRGSTVVASQRARATAKGFEDAVREVGAIVGRKVLRLK